MRKTVKALAFGAIATSLVLTAACSANTGTDTTEKDRKAASIVMDTDGKFVGPAKEVAGAKTGGTITILEDGQPEHLDPAAIYVSNALSYGQLFHRALVGYIESPKEGEPLNVVGDLATNSGVTTDGGKTWTYTLRDGIKFEDGTPITSEHIKYGIARTFTTIGAQGPQYHLPLLDPNFGKDNGYKGAYDGGLNVPGIETPDAKTIKFTLTSPAPHFPFLMAFQTSTPVQAAKDTKEKYDFGFQSTGPYKVAEFLPDTRMVLEKNPNWDPKSDPIRHQYVDKFFWDFTASPQVQAERLIAGNGGDAAAVMIDNVPPTLIPTVKNDAEVMKRVHSAPNQYVYVMNINTTRVTDVDVRRAINYAIDKDAYIKAAGGESVGTVASTIAGPVIPGWVKYDAYPAVSGKPDVEKAKKALEGKTVPKLTYCFSNTATNQAIAAVFQENLKQVGIEITTKPIERSAYYTTIGKKGIDCDLMASAWGPDWPSSSSVIGVLMDGSKIVDEGNNNYSYFNDPAINAKIAEYDKMIDIGAAADLYAALDKEIMEKHAPLVPLRYGATFSISGANVGNTFLNQFSQFDVLGAYVK